MAAAALAALLLSAGLLAGCGQKGSLYLPSQKKTKVPPSSTQPPPDTQPGSSPPQSTAPAPS